MGLDVSHDCWRGPYSSFHYWRCALATASGFDLNTMPGFTDEPTGSWDGVDPGALALLHHSDCDGVLTVEECQAILPWLEGLTLEDEYDSDRRDRFCEGLRLAIADNVEVEFH